MNTAPGRGLAAALNRAAAWIAVVLLAVLVGIWAWDRARRRDEPAWDPAGFVTLTPATDAAARSADLWLVAVNPGCPHCRARLGEISTNLPHGPGAPRLGALIVDTTRRPDTLSLAVLAPAGVYWDSAQVWRTRWGHRVYGEALVFAPGGEYRRTLPPGAALAEPVAR